MSGDLGRTTLESVKNQWEHCFPSLSHTGFHRLGRFFDPLGMLIKQLISINQFFDAFAVRRGAGRSRTCFRSLKFHVSKESG